MARPLREGGGKGLVTKKKKTFFEALKNPQKNPLKNVATKLQGGGLPTTI